MNVLVKFIRLCGCCPGNNELMFLEQIELDYVQVGKNKILPSVPQPGFLKDRNICQKRNGIRSWSSGHVDVQIFVFTYIMNLTGPRFQPKSRLPVLALKYVRQQVMCAVNFAANRREFRDWDANFSSGSRISRPGS